MKNIHYTYLFLVLSLITAGCKKFDTLMPDPQLREISESQAEIINAFSGLTGNDPTACNLISDPTEIPDVLCRILSDAKPGSEIIFLVDKTTSMVEEIDQVKININKIIDCLPKGCRLGAATYGDNRTDPFNGITWYKSEDLNDNYDYARNFVNDITLEGGGYDLPESVYDALWKALDEMSWKDCNAPDKIIVMGDAGPKTGDLTDHTLNDVLDKSKSLCPDTEFFPVIVLNI